METQRALFIGDYNFNNDHLYNRNKKISMKEYNWKNHVTFPTVVKKNAPSQARRDLVAQYWKKKTKPLTLLVKPILDPAELAYDHKPISITIG